MGEDPRAVRAPTCEAVIPGERSETRDPITGAAGVWGHACIHEGRRQPRHRHGDKALMGPMQVPGGQWIVRCQDPQGAHFALLVPVR